MIKRCWTKEATVGHGGAERSVMEPTSWLTLTDYSAKYRVSVSTLRRRIKSETIRYHLDQGKYYLPDQPLVEVEVTGSERFPGLESPVRPMMPPPTLQNPPSLRSLETSAETEAMDFSTAKMLLQEIKKAYMNVLQEKEEQIINLKNEVADLNTLVRALEKENERINQFVERVRAPQGH